jgi:polyisoprenoid-binding protein YceI
MLFARLLEAFRIFFTINTLGWPEIKGKFTKHYGAANIQKR